MTIQGAINELMNLLDVDDIPIYYKPTIEKVIDTIILDRARGKTDRKDEPNSSEKPNNCEPQTETSTNSEKIQLKVQLTDEPQTDCGWK